jgi:hypothetical protein
MRKTVASIGRGYRDEFHDDKQDIALAMRKTKQKPEQQLGLEPWKQVRNFRVIRAPDSR